MILLTGLPVTYDELSGTYNLSKMVSNGIPDQVRDWLFIKPEEFASIIYWGNATTENNTAAAYWFNQFNTLLASIKMKVQVEGYERNHSFSNTFTKD